MSEDDFDPFDELLNAVCSLLSRGAYIPAPENTALYFRALSRYSLLDVRAALDAHVADPQRGRFVPTPADVIAQINGSAAADGRPEADEAWATAVRSVDEIDTVVWTEETQQAWAIARPVFDRGDEIGARMAFRQAYDRMVTTARERRVPVSWLVSEGFDAGKRALALTRAAERLQLPQTEVAALLAPPAVAGLGDLLNRPDVPEHARQAIERFKARVAAKAAAPGVDGIEKARTARLKSEAAAKVDDYTEGRT